VVIRTTNEWLSLVSLKKKKKKSPLRPQGAVAGPLGATSVRELPCPAADVGVSTTLAMETGMPGSAVERMSLAARNGGHPSEPFPLGLR
jgi:hypothetical protein